MGDAKEFAEEVARLLLEQQERFRTELSVQVQEIKTSVTAIKTKTEACHEDCQRRINCLETQDKLHENEHKGIVGKIVAMLIATIGSLAAALWAVFRDRP